MWLAVSGDVTLVGIGALLAGCGSFLSGFAALKVARKAAKKEGKDEGGDPADSGPRFSWHKRVPDEHGAERGSAAADEDRDG